MGEGGYQVGNFPRGWAEWNDKYRDTVRALSGRAMAAQLGGVRLSRSPAPAICTQRERPQAVRQHQLRHRARRLHASGSGQLQRQAQRSQRRRQSRRHQRQSTAGIAAPKGQPTIRRSIELARAPEAQFARDAAALAGRAHAAAAATKSATRRTATTTPIARTTRSAGFRGIPRRWTASFSAL